MLSNMSGPHDWYILHHRPGPSVAAGESVFDQPGIKEHYQFLRRRATAGQLIAAGPMDDGSGEGMTILEVASLAQARQLANEDDPAVVTGLLTVAVRPWRVLMSR